MKTTLILISILGLVQISCGGKQADDTSAVGEIDQSGNSAGTFIMKSSSAPAAHERYNFGCAQMGSQSGVSQIDSRLRAGMSFTHVFRQWDNDQKRLGILFKEEIKNVSTDSWSSVMSLLKAQGLGIPAGMSVTQTCRQLTDQAGQKKVDCKMDSNQQVTDPPVKPKSCYVNPTDPNQFQKQEVDGQFTFAENGRVIRAFKTTYRSTGDLVCNDGTQGKGSSLSIIIQSNDTPSINQSGYFCGGVPVFSFGIVKDANGNPIVMTNFERLSD